MMKKLIYNLFTVENGIVLSTAVISYIEEKIKSNEDLINLLNVFKSRFNSSSITKEQIDVIFNSKTEDKIFYSLEAFKFEYRDLCKEFEHFKNQFQNKSISISLIEQGIESTIFGIFYKNRNGKFCLEDDYDIIDLDISNINNSIFLFDGMFIGAKGVKNENFKVSEFILPSAQLYNKQNLFMENLKPKICVFNLKNACSMTDINNIHTIISIESPNITILFSKENVDISILKNVCKEIIICHIAEDSDFLPDNTFGISNPFLLETFDYLFGFIATDVFRNRHDGLFFNKSPMDSFIRSFISQNSLYPFGNCKLSAPYFPNALVILQDFHPVVQTIDSVKILSLPSFKENYYAVLNLLTGNFEVKMTSSII